AAAAPGRGAAALADRLPGVGHELRQRHQRHRGGGAQAARQGGRALRAQAHSHRARHGLRARSAAAGAGMMRAFSLTARLALLFAALTAGVLVLAALLFGRMLDAHFEELDLHELHGKLALVRNAVQQAVPGTGAAEPIRVLENAFVGHDNVGVLVRDVDGRVLRIIHDEHFTPEQRAGARLAAGRGDWSVEGRPHRGRAVRLALPPRAGGGAPSDAAGVDVLVALDLSHHTHFLASVRKATWAGVALAALVAALLGWFAAHRGLAPLRRVTDTARRLSARQLSERLAVDDARSEEHTSELQSRENLVCRLLLEKKKD